MIVHVRIFASAAAPLGRKELALTLPGGATVDDALAVLSMQLGVYGDFRDKLATAVNMRYVKASHVLSDGDELALIPPVSGG